MDNWKGQHLIRTPPRQVARTADAPRREGIPCLHPGCGKIIDKRNLSGFCRQHYNQASREKRL